MEVAVVDDAVGAVAALGVSVVLDVSVVDVPTAGCDIDHRRGA